MDTATVPTVPTVPKHDHGAQDGLTLPLPLQLIVLRHAGFSHFFNGHEVAAKQIFNFFSIAMLTDKSGARARVSL